MPTDKLPEFFALACRLADASGPIIRKYFRAPITVDDKPDSSPVTAADREAEQAIRAILNAERTQDGIIGEEYGSENLEAEFVWVIDPIDGTKSFITGRPIFGTLIALVQNGEPILGVIDQPVINERWTGIRGGRATCNDTPIQTRACAALSNAVIGTTSPDLFEGTDIGKWRVVSGAGKHVVYGGDCYTYAQLSGGFVDVVMESGLQTYDYCALVPVIEAAGGVVTDWHGNPLTLNSDGTILACGDRGVHAEILSLIGG